MPHIYRRSCIPVRILELYNLRQTTGKDKYKYRAPCSCRRCRTSSRRRASCNSRRTSRTCVASKVQVVLQFEVCRGLGEVLLSQYGLNYQSEVVSKFGPLRGPRCRDNLTHWLISTQSRTCTRTCPARRILLYWHILGRRAASGSRLPTILDCKHIHQDRRRRTV